MGRAGIYQFWYDKDSVC